MKLNDLHNIYDLTNVMLYADTLYERLVNAPSGHKWRRIISPDDYDYVEDQKLISRLDQLWEL